MATSVEMGAKAAETLMKTPEFEPPQASVARIIKAALPSDVQLSKDAKAAFSRASGIFIFYLTHCANEFKTESKRSTIQAQDVVSALKELDFGDLEGPMEEFLELYKKEQKEEAAKKKAEKASKSSSSSSSDGDAAVDATTEETEEMAESRDAGDEQEEGDAEEEEEEEAPEDNEREGAMDTDP